jgi:hypothetical protein
MGPLGLEAQVRSYSSRRLNAHKICLCFKVVKRLYVTILHQRLKSDMAVYVATGQVTSRFSMTVLACHVLTEAEAY